MEESQVRRGRGRPRKTIRETIRKDLEVNELDPNLVYDRTLWRHLIHVADPTWWDKARLLLLLVVVGCLVQDLTSILTAIGSSISG